MSTAQPVDAAAQLRALFDLLEADLFCAITNFERCTGLCVQSIDLQRRVDGGLLQAAAKVGTSC